MNELHDTAFLFLFHCLILIDFIGCIFCQGLVYFQRLSGFSISSSWFHLEIWVNERCIFKYFQPLSRRSVPAVDAISSCSFANSIDYKVLDGNGHVLSEAMKVKIIFGEVKRNLKPSLRPEETKHSSLDSYPLQPSSLLRNPRTRNETRHNLIPTEKSISLLHLMIGSASLLGHQSLVPFRPQSQHICKGKQLTHLSS